MTVVPYFSVQLDPWSWFQNSRLGLSRPGIGLNLDRIVKSRLALVVVLNEIIGLAELMCSARLLVIVSKFKTWPFKIRYWFRYFQIRTSLGLGLEKTRMQDIP